MENAMLIPVVNSLDVERAAPPREIKLFPLGLVKSQKGDFLIDTESYNSILNHFKTHHVDIPIDYEHQTLLDVQAPAAGWIKDLTLGHRITPVITRDNGGDIHIMYHASNSLMIPFLLLLARVGTR